MHVLKIIYIILYFNFLIHEFKFNIGINSFQPLIYINICIDIYLLNFNNIFIINYVDIF